nr:hypothetical protein [Saprospiraceae bacterium]
LMKAGPIDLIFKKFRSGVLFAFWAIDIIKVRDRKMEVNIFFILQLLIKSKSITFDELYKKWVFIYFFISFNFFACTK